MSCGFGRPCTLREEECALPSCSFNLADSVSAVTSIILPSATTNTGFTLSRKKLLNNLLESLPTFPILLQH